MRVRESALDPDEFPERDDGSWDHDCDDDDDLWFGEARLTVENCATLHAGDIATADTLSGEAVAVVVCRETAVIAVSEPRETSVGPMAREDVMSEWRSDRSKFRAKLDL